MIEQTNGSVPKVVHQVQFALLDNGHVGASSTADPLLTMKIVGLAMSALADAFAEKAQKKIVIPTPDLGSLDLRK